MILLSLLLAAQAVSPDIVVNGQRLDDAAALCAKGQCTTLRDAQVSITLAERSFRAGNYLAAKRTLSAAIAREKGHAATDPKPVSALYEAYATVAIHDGDETAYRKAVVAQVWTLRDNLPPDDPAVADAMFSLGDMWVKLGRYYEADQAYDGVERRARAEGRTRIATLATMRRVGLLSGMHDDGQANAMLAKLEKGPGANDPSLAPVFRVLRLRMAIRKGDQPQIDALIRDIGHGEATAPVLVWAPPYAPTGAAAAQDDELRFSFLDRQAASSTDNDPYLWADIGFWIRPDGHTGDVTILRQYPAAGGWATPYLSQISQRRYTASTDAAGEGTYRVERFTLRGTYTTPVGSLIRRRAGPMRLEVLDLTQPGSATTSASPPVRS